MRRNTFPTRTSAARSVARSRQSRCFIERTPQQRAAGLGIVIASSADAPIASITAHPIAINEMPGLKPGGSTTLKPRQRMTNEPASKRNTGYLLTKWSRCAHGKMAAAQYVSAQRRDFSLITATSRAMSEPCFARHATRFLAGTRRRPTRFYDSSVTSTATPNNHADVLLELANREDAGA